MSIGKNAIKRVENNGYSNVKTTAPDMVNSTVIGATSEQVLEMVENVGPEVTQTKVKAKTKKAKKVEKKNFFAIGDEIPVYYL